MSKKFKSVKNWYDKGLWSNKRVKDAVISGWITAEEYESITQETYTALDTESSKEEISYRLPSISEN